MKLSALTLYITRNLTSQRLIEPPLQLINFVYKAVQLCVEDVSHVTDVLFQVPDLQVTGTQHLQSLVMPSFQLLLSHQSAFENAEVHEYGQLPNLGHHRFLDMQISDAPSSQGYAKS
jgi:hypothetical protein